MAAKIQQYPKDLYSALEEWSGRPFDHAFIDWFSELPGRDYSSWLSRIGQLTSTPLPPLTPGLVRPFISKPYYSPARGRWGPWWHRGAYLLLLTEQVAITEPLVTALLTERQREPPRGTPNAVRDALEVLLVFRHLAETGVIYWVNEVADRGLFRLAQSMSPVSNQIVHKLQDKRRPVRQEVWDALAEAEACRRKGRMMPVVQGYLTRQELQMVQRVLAPEGLAGGTFLDLCNLDVPALALPLADLVGLRTTADSFAAFRKDLGLAMGRLPDEILNDPIWRNNASALTMEALQPSRIAIERELHKSSALTAARVAGESVAFSIAGLAAGTAVGGIATPAALVSTVTAAVARAARETFASRKYQQERKSQLKIIKSFTIDDHLE